MEDYRTVLDYWFPKDVSPARLHGELWFAGSARVDAEVRERFLPAVEQAERGELDAWQ